MYLRFLTLYSSYVQKCQWNKIHLAIYKYERIKYKKIITNRNMLQNRFYTAISFLFQINTIRHNKKNINAYIS